MYKKRMKQVIEKIEKLQIAVEVSLSKNNLNEANRLWKERCQLVDNNDLFDKDFVEDGKVGLKDVLGNILIPPIYSGFSEVYSYIIKRGEPVAAFNENMKLGLVTTGGNGTPITSFEYDLLMMLPFSPYYLCGKKIDDNMLVGVLDKNGDEIIPCTMDKVYGFVNDSIIFKKGDKYGYWSIYSCCSEPIYDEIDIDEECNVWVKIGDKSGYLDIDEDIWLYEQRSV